MRRWPASRETSENPAAARAFLRFAPPRPAIAFPVGEDAYPGYIPTFLWSDAVFRAKEMDFAHDGLKYVDHLRSNIKIIYNIAGNTLINQHSDINRTIRIFKGRVLVRADRDE